MRRCVRAGRTCWRSAARTISPRRGWGNYCISCAVSRDAPAERFAALAGASRLTALPEVPGAPRRTNRRPPPPRRRGEFRIQNLGRNRVFSDYQVTNPPPAASTASRSAASTWATTPANAPISAPTRSAPASTSKPCWPPCATRRRRSSAGARPPSRTRKSICNTRTTPRRRASAAAPLRPAARPGGNVLRRSGHVEGRRPLSEPHRSRADVPEQVTILSDAMEFMEREIEHQEMAERERDLARRAGARRAVAGAVGPADSPALSLPNARRGVPRLPRPLHPRRRHGPGQDAANAGRGGAAGPRARHRAVLVVAPASVKYQWETEIRKFTGRTVQVIDGGSRSGGARTSSRRSTVLSTTKWRCATSTS